MKRLIAFVVCVLALGAGSAQASTWPGSHRDRVLAPWQSPPVTIAAAERAIAAYWAPTPPGQLRTACERQGRSEVLCAVSVVVGSASIETSGRTTTALVWATDLEEVIPGAHGLVVMVSGSAQIS